MLRQSRLPLCAAHGARLPCRAEDVSRDPASVPKLPKRGRTAPQIPPSDVVESGRYRWPKPDSIPKRASVLSSDSEYYRVHAVGLRRMRSGALGARSGLWRAVLYRRSQHRYLLPAGVSSAPRSVRQCFVFSVGRGSRSGGFPSLPAVPAWDRSVLQRMDRQQGDSWKSAAAYRRGRRARCGGGYRRTPRGAPWCRGKAADAAIRPLPAGKSLGGRQDCAGAAG